MYVITQFQTKLSYLIVFYNFINAFTATSKTNLKDWFYRTLRSRTKIFSMSLDFKRSRPRSQKKWSYHNHSDEGKQIVTDLYLTNTLWAMKVDCQDW